MARKFRLGVNGGGVNEGVNGGNNVCVSSRAERREKAARSNLFPPASRFHSLIPVCLSRLPCLSSLPVSLSDLRLSVSASLSVFPSGFTL